MKKSTTFITLFAFIAFFALISCNNTPKASEENQQEEAQTQTVDEFDLMMKFIEENGDYLNSKAVPSMITADKLKELMGTNILLVDLRSSKDFSAAHIEGAQNTKLGGLVDFAYENAFFDYDKVIMVCYSGQTASYGTSVLRLLGYDNVYALKWGMSSWNEKTAHHWMDNASNKYATQLETTAYPKNAVGDYPTIKTGKTDGQEILEARAAEVLGKGFKPAIIKVDKIMENPADYYIINYWSAALYNKGHLSGAVQYLPKNSLGRATELNTLPTDKPVVVYCYTGQHAAFVAAYLNILGYDAKTIAYGANSFMNTVMAEDEEIGHAYSKGQVKGYKVEKTEYVETAETAEEEGGC